MKYDRSAHKIVDTFSVFIHPCVHSEFSVGAKALPQLWRSLESRLTFEQAYTAFLDWVGEETMFAAWGGGDWHVLNDNAKSAFLQSVVQIIIPYRNLTLI